MSDTNVAKRRGRVALLDSSNRKKLAAFLAAGKFDDLTIYTKAKLVAAGYLSVEKIQTGKRGRPAEVLHATGKAAGLVALSRQWGKKAVKTEAPVTEAPVTESVAA